MLPKVNNVVVAGLGGQGVLKGTDILADVALRAGYDVKKSEIKGMSQRGGSVTSDVRFGGAVLSPMVSPGEADYLLVLDATQVEPLRHYLKPGGVLIMETMTIEMLHTRPDYSPEYLLQPGELRHAFAEWEMLVYREGWVEMGLNAPRAVASIVAKRPA